MVGCTCAGNVDAVDEVVVIGCESNEPVLAATALGGEGGEGSTIVEGEVEGAGGRGVLADAADLQSSDVVIGDACCCPEISWLSSAIEIVYRFIRSRRMQAGEAGHTTGLCSRGPI